MEKDLLQYTALAEFLEDTLGERYSVALVHADDLKQERTVETGAAFSIRNEKGDVIAFLCIDEKETDRVTVKEVLDQMLGPETLEPEPADNSSRHIGEEVDAFMREHISEVWNRYKTPGKRMQKADKLAFVSELMENGFFRMKGAAVQISKVTGISIASIYRYLAEAVES